MQTMLEQFNVWHRENPHVYALLVELAQKAHDTGRQRIGMKALGEVARWEHNLRTSGDFKINNNYLAFYARLIARDYPHLAHLFTFRRQRGTTIPVEAVA